MTLMQHKPTDAIERLKSFTWEAAMAATKPKPAWTPPPDMHWLRLAPHPSVTLVLGRRGSGKSALGYRLLELLRGHGSPYVVGLPASAQRRLPEWVGFAGRLEDVPLKAVVLLDEAYLQYHARDAMGAEGRNIGQIVNLSRQRQQSLVFVCQEAKSLDVNVISQADVIAIKELSELSKGFERKELKPFTDKARIAFAHARGNKQRLTWVYSESTVDVGLVKNNLASFWTPALSKAFTNTPTGPSSNGTEDRKGARTPRAELVSRAKALHQQGYSFRQIGKMLGIGGSTAVKYVREADSSG